MRSPVTLAFLGEHLLGDLEGVERCGRAAIRAAVQEDLADLLLRHAVVERALEMELELVRAVDRGEDRKIEHAADLRRQALAHPGGAPHVLGDVVLEVGHELVGLRDRILDVLGAQDFLADREALLVRLALAHRLLQEKATGRIPARPNRRYSGFSTTV
jgi:hypothetical protein